MKSVLGESLDSLRGVLDIEQGPSGWTPHRTPREFRERMNDPGLTFVSSCPSGARIELNTDADSVELDLAVTRVELDGTTAASVAVDVVLDGALVGSVPVPHATVVRIHSDGSLTTEAAEHERVQLTFPATSTTRQVEIWLPSNAAIEIVDVRIPGDATLRPASSGAMWAHYGSSISQCAEVPNPLATWPALVARSAGASLVNLGLAGHCHLDQSMARALRDLNASAISLEVGINITEGATMTERTFVPALHGFLDTIRDGAPSTPIAVITPIFCGALEETPGPSARDSKGSITAATDRRLIPGALTLRRVRELLAHHISLRQAEGDTQLFLIDGLELLDHTDADRLPDGLHPDQLGYQLMAERFLTLAFGAGGALRPASPLAKASE